MIKLIQRIFFLLSFFLLVSFGSFGQIKNKSAQEFTNTIDTTLNSFISAAENFSKYLGVVMLISKQDTDFKLDKNKIDSLKNYYTVYINTIEKGISKLSNLNEFDTSLKITTPCLDFFKRTKEAYSSTFPSWFRVFQLGWNRATDSDKQIMISTGKILHDANPSSNEYRNIMRVINQFKEKYL